MRLSAMVWPVYACYTGGKTSYCLFSCNELRRFPKLATSHCFGGRQLWV